MACHCLLHTQHRNIKSKIFKKKITYVTRIKHDVYYIDTSHQNNIPTEQYSAQCRVYLIIE